MENCSILNLWEFSIEFSYTIYNYTISDDPTMINLRRFQRFVTRILHRDRLFLGEGRKEKESIKDSQLLNWISKLLLLLLLVLVQTRADNKVWEQLVRCKFCFNHVRNTNPFGEWKKRKIRGKRKIQRRSFERILFNFLFHTRPIRHNFPLLVVFAKMIELSIISTRVSNKSLERSDS